MHTPFRQAGCLCGSSYGRLKLIPVSNSKVLLLLKSMDKNDEKVLVIEQGGEQ